VGTEPGGFAESLHRAHQSPIKTRMGSESPERGLDRSHLGVRQGDRITVTGHYRFGFGQAEGPITTDNEGIWLVIFDNGQSESFDYDLLRKSFSV